MQKRHPLCFQFDRSNRTSGHLLRSITAKATDNSGNAASNTTSSAPIQLTVTQGVAQVYYIHTDQLNTPRLITNAANAKVWEWGNDDPFANNPVNDDPNATGNHFTYNPRLPGQYFDSETNTNYNYYQDYDPATGRYIESDPIGLEGGINTYGYVNASPIRFYDPLGLLVATATGGVGGGFMFGPVGGSLSDGGIVGTDGKRCRYKQICARFGFGFYVGGGLSGGLGVNAGSTSDAGGVSLGIGADVALGAGAGGTVGAGSSSVGISRGSLGLGVGLAAGLDLCSTIIVECYDDCEVKTK